VQSEIMISRYYRHRMISKIGYSNVQNEAKEGSIVGGNPASKAAFLMLGKDLRKEASAAPVL